MEYNALLIINVFVVCIALGAVVTLLFMIHENTILNEQIDKEIKQIEKKCPDCNCPECPKCPPNPDCNSNCPELPDCPTCPKCPQIPDELLKNINKAQGSPQITSQKECPKCQICPSVDDIVSGVFPGRNTKVIDGGRYFNIDASNTYDGLSTSNFYEQNYKFPIDKILKPDEPMMNSYNLGGEDQIDNSIDNENIDTNISKDLPAVNKDEVMYSSEPPSEDNSGDNSGDNSDNDMGHYYQKILNF